MDDTIKEDDLNQIVKAFVVKANQSRPVRGAVDPVRVHELHATMLHLLGIDHKKLTYFHNGRTYRLTDAAGNVLSGVLF